MFIYILFLIVVISLIMTVLVNIIPGIIRIFTVIGIIAYTVAVFGGSVAVAKASQMDKKQRCTYVLLDMLRTLFIDIVYFFIYVADNGLFTRHSSMEALDTANSSVFSEFGMLIAYVIYFFILSAFTILPNQLIMSSNKKAAMTKGAAAAVNQNIALTVLCALVFVGFTVFKTLTR